FSNASAQQFHVGVFGGLHKSNMTITDDFGKDQETESMNYGGVGAVLGYTLNSQFTVEIQPMYMQKGALLKGSTTDPGDIDLEFKSHFIDVPVLLKMHFGEEARPYLLAGPRLGYKLSSTAGGNVMGIEFEADTDPVMNSIDLGLTLGAGISVPIRKLHGFIEGRYSWGFIDLNKGGTVEFKGGGLTQVDEVSKDAELKNKGLEILFGLTMPLGK
ncbi:MAG: PorT family protein, partial [Calditrichaeota bacterium]